MGKSQDPLQQAAGFFTKTDAFAIAVYSGTQPIKFSMVRMISMELDRRTIHYLV
jgi:hypothetical protein